MKFEIAFESTAGRALVLRPDRQKKSFRQATFATQLSENMSETLRQNYAPGRSVKAQAVHDQRKPATPGAAVSSRMRRIFMLQ
jgi:hypothetical protein